MAGAKEIRTKIKSIENTKKITKAMEMVAASKMRKAQERMEHARPYARKVRNVVAHLSQSQAEYTHTYAVERETRRVGFIVVSTDRGLCGGLNVNLFRSALGAMQEWQDKGVESDISSIGSKGLTLFKRIGANVVSQTTHVGDAPSMNELIGTIKVMLDAYAEERIDRLYLCLLYTSPSPRDATLSRMPSSA